MTKREEEIPSSKFIIFQYTLFESIAIATNKKIILFFLYVFNRYEDLGETRAANKNLTFLETLIP